MNTSQQIRLSLALSSILFSLSAPCFEFGSGMFRLGLALGTLLLGVCLGMTIQERLDEEKAEQEQKTKEEECQSK